MRTRRVKVAAAAVTLAASGVLGTGTAWAEPPPKRLIPTSPPGLNNPHENRPEQAETPLTGPLNQFREHPPQAENP